MESKNYGCYGCYMVAWLKDFRFHNSAGSRQTVERASVRWRAPSLGLCKINVDGAFNQQTRKGGWGFVIRDHSGVMLAGGSGHVRCLISAEHAEVVACCKAVEFAADQGFLPAILETDALVVKHQLESSDGPNMSLLGRLYDDLKAQLQNQGLWMVSHIRRQGNRAAHTLAARAVSLQRDEFYVSTPAFLAAVITAEMCIV